MALRRVALLLLHRCLAGGSDVCEETSLLQRPSAQHTEPLKGPAAHGDKAALTRVLVFWPTGSSAAAKRQIRRNVDHLRAFEAESAAKMGAKFDVYLVHYDLNRRAWQGDGAEWYSRNVRYSVEQRGIKFSLGKKLLVDQLPNSPNVNLTDYDWVWFLDEDADFTSMNLEMALETAEKTGSAIVAPAITFLQAGTAERPALTQTDRSACQPHDRLCTFQSPNRTCRFRYVNFIEVSFPLIRPKAFMALARTQGAVSEVSVWGLDSIWCKLTPRITQQGHPLSSCAIMDQTPIVHRNFKTLDKYRKAGILATYHRQKKKVRETFPSDYEETKRTHRCVP